jgi:hypothetical protein
LVTANESAVFAKSFFDPIVVEDGESNGSFSNPPCTDESDGFKIFCKSDDLLDEFVASETVPRRGGR